MKNSRKQMEQTMRNVLSSIESSGVVSQSSQEELYALKQCCEYNFVDGVRVLTMGSGRVVAEYSAPKLTYAGQKFLHPYVNWKFIVPTAVAILELIVIIIQTIHSVVG